MQFRRRVFLRLASPLLAGAAVWKSSRLLAGRTVAAQSSTSAPALPLTAACNDGSPTPPQLEGPFYTPNSPQRISLLEPGLAGTVLMLTGQVVATDCTPIANALVDFWHADDLGNYDNAGYQLRGHQFTDAEGRYRLETIVPGIYPGRTRHIHVKVQAPDGPLLTTQIYFPAEPENQRDRFFQSDLLVDISDVDNPRQASFNFVVATA